MKQVINGKMYNTDTAKMVASYSTGYPGTVERLEEDLYLKKTGEFFLHGQGGQLTKYADCKTYCRNRGLAMTIIPLSKSEAQSWVEEYADADTYIELFGEPEE